MQVSRAAGVIMSPARPEDAQKFAPLLREPDRQELEAALGTQLPIEFILRDGIESSLESWLVTFNGQPAMLWGVSTLRVNVAGAPVDVPPEKTACGWLLTTHQVSQNPRLFWEVCNILLPQILDRYEVLVNWIDMRHTQALRWGKKLGFRFVPSKPHGAMGLPFSQFYVRKEYLSCAHQQQSQRESVLSSARASQLAVALSPVKPSNWKQIS